MKIMDAKAITILVVTTLILTIIFVFSDKSYAFPESIPVIESFEPIPEEGNALKVKFKSDNLGDDYSYELMNVTAGTVNKLSGSVTEYTFQGLEANKEYEVAIRACDNNGKYECSVLSPSKKAVINKSGPTIDGNSSLTIGTPAQLKATFPNSCLGISASGVTCDNNIVDVTNKVTWQSDNELIATVSNTGLITPHNPGETYIKATYKHEDSSTVFTKYKISVTKPARNDADSNQATATIDNSTDTSNTNSNQATATIDNSTDTSNTKYNVTFDIYNGKQTNVVQVNGNSLVSKPANPTKEGYTFAGWYKDKEFTTVYDFTKPVTSNITIYAKWNINTYTVTFNSNGGSAVSSVKVKYKEVIKKPTNPTRSGYYFAGWYTDTSYEEKFSFLTEIKKDITLYADWYTQPVQKHDVTFVPGHGIDPFIMEISPGGSAEVPSVTFETTNKSLVEGATVSWYTDEAKTIPYNFETVVTQDIVLYGKWVDKEGTEIMEAPDAGVEANIIYITVGIVLAVGGGFVIVRYLLQRKQIS